MRFTIRNTQVRFYLPAKIVHDFHITTFHKSGLTYNTKVGLKLGLRQLRQN